ncbi:hypothetical protein LCGC14_2349480, partial [marine sediment metagenome]
LEFPFKTYRSGQRRMAEGVYRAIKNNRQLIIQAATGIGKTIGVIFPAVKAMVDGFTEKIFYLTARSTGKAAAETTLGALRKNGLKIKSITLTAKDKICFRPQSACSGNECEYAKGFYDRLGSGLEEGEGSVHQAGQRLSDAGLELGPGGCAEVLAQFAVAGARLDDDGEGVHPPLARYFQHVMRRQPRVAQDLLLDLRGEDVDAADVEAFKLYSKHFPTYLRRDSGVFLRKMSVEKLETKLLSVDRDPGGGYWVKPEVSNRIVTKVFETSPVRQFAAIENIGSDSLEILADEDEAASGWVAEQESRSQTDTPDIGVRKIHAHELYAKPRATQKLLDDAGFDVEGWLARKVSEKFARDEATAFVTGTGVGRPRGFTTYADGTSTGTIEQIASGAAQLLTADGIFNLVYALKGPYLPNARFMGARLTHRDIRKLKDGDGRYLWEPIFKVGQPATLIGYPIHQADDMASVSGGNLALAFGDFKAAYTIVDRKGIRVLRDPYTAKPYVVFYTTRRVGGDVVNFEAIKLQDIAASGRYGLIYAAGAAPTPNASEALGIKT